jgi:hypothetical protein
MPLYTYNGLLLKVNSALATNSGCCCGGSSCCLLGICIGNLTEDECQRVGGNFNNYACDNSGHQPPCPCDAETQIRCCLPTGQIVEGGGLDVDNNPVSFTDCDCKRFGGVTFYPGDTMNCPSIKDCTDGLSPEEWAALQGKYVCVAGNNTSGGYCVVIGEGGIETEEDYCLQIAFGAGVYDTEAACNAACGTIPNQTLTCPSACYCTATKTYQDVSTDILLCGSTYVCVPTTTNETYTWHYQANVAYDCGGTPVTRPCIRASIDMYANFGAGGGAPYFCPPTFTIIRTVKTCQCGGSCGTGSVNSFSQYHCVNTYTTQYQNTLPCSGCLS